MERMHFCRNEEISWNFHLIRVTCVIIPTELRGCPPYLNTLSKETVRKILSGEMLVHIAVVEIKYNCLLVDPEGQMPLMLKAIMEHDSSQIHLTSSQHKYLKSTLMLSYFYLVLILYSSQ
jgi:hypothetical protein